MRALRQDLHCEPALCEDQRKMYRIVVLLVLCHYVLSQPVIDESSTRHLIECCPCPSSRNEDQQDMLAASGQLARAGGMDDCPCRPRDADSEGAPSVFFRSAIRADRPFTKTTDPKEDSKNLLEPEVALATSMLDTLKEATEEEYRDALARDASRNAAEPDAVPEETASNVVIIVNPRDSDNDGDFISEASHVQESRCIHPLGSMSLGRMRSSPKPVKLLPETLVFPKLKSPDIFNRNLLHLDSDLGASNLDESILDINGNSRKFQSRTPMFKLTTPLKDILNKRNEAHSIKNPSSEFDQLDENESSILEGLKFPLPKLKTPKKMFLNNALRPAPYKVQEQSEVVDDKTNHTAKQANLPLNLRNFLKLRDVEVIPKSNLNKPLNPKLDKSKFNIPTLLKKKLNHNSFKNYCEEKITSAENFENIKDMQNFKIDSTKDIISSLNQINESSKSNIINDYESEIVESKRDDLDTIPSPSYTQPLVMKADIEKEPEADVSAADLTENEHDSSFLKSKDLEPIQSLSNEIQDKLKEIVIDSGTLETTTVLTVESSNNNDEEDNEIDDALQNQDLNTDNDSETDSSHNISTLVPLEIKQRDAIEFLPQSQESVVGIKPSDQKIEGHEIQSLDLAMALDDRKITPHIKHNPTLSETLSSLRENVVKKLETLKKPSIKSELFRMSNNKDNIIVLSKEVRDIPDDENESQRLKTHESNQMMIDLHSKDAETPEVKENIRFISMHDLQDMSDKLLDSNSRNQKETSFLKAAETKLEDVNVKLSELESEIDSTSSDSNSLNNVNDLLDDKKSIKEDKNSCSFQFENTNRHEGEEETFKSASQETIQKEMDTGASNTVIKTLPSIFNSLNYNSKLRTPLLEDIVAQPLTDPINKLRKPLGDVLNLNANLPTLKDFREQLGTIFNTNDKSVEDDSFSLENDLANDCALETMAPESSTINFQRKLPSFKQLEDLNVDVFGSNPFTLISSDTLSKTPKFTLDTYRGKVPVPRTLDLKPVKIDSRLGNKAETDRLNFRSDKMFSQKTKPENSLANPFQNIPTLDELRNTVRSNTKNLLNSPVHPELNLFTEDLRSNDAENIRINSQKTMKGIHKKMKSTLRKSKFKGPLGDTLLRPQELLDDMNDKLKALHYDLNDRLSSIHENIMDSSKFKALVDQPRKTANRNVMTNLRKNKEKPSRLQTAASTIVTQKIDPHINTKKNDLTLDTEPRNYINTVTQNKSHKIQSTSERALNLPRVNMLKLENSSSSHFQRSPNLSQNRFTPQFLRRERKPLSAFLKDSTNFENIERPVLRPALRPFNNQRQSNKVTISFGTTTARPVSVSRPVLTPRIPSMASPQFKEHSPGISSSEESKSTRERVSVLNHKLKSAGSTKVSPFQFKALRTSAPLPSSYDEEFEDSTNNFFFEKSPVLNSNLRSSVLREMPHSNELKIHDNSMNEPNSANFFDGRKETLISVSEPSEEMSSVWPKGTTTNPFLTKVRDAVDYRLSNYDRKTVKDVKTQFKSDMLKSPSENTDIISDEPLKENVSYRCRMVCSKEFR